MQETSNTQEHQIELPGKCVLHNTAFKYFLQTFMCVYVLPFKGLGLVGGGFFYVFF